MRLNKTVVRVRYSETDKMGVVHHSHHLSWFEIGRTELLREHGCTYKDLEEKGIFMPVVEISCRYNAPARYDEILEVETEVKEMTYVRIRFDYKVRKISGGVLIATGFSTHVCTDAAGTPKRFPDFIRDVLQVGTAQLKEG